MGLQNLWASVMNLAFSSSSSSLSLKSVVLVNPALL